VLDPRVRKKRIRVSAHPDADDAPSDPATLEQALQRQRTNEAARTEKAAPRGAIDGERCFFRLGPLVVGEWNARDVRSADDQLPNGSEPQAELRGEQGDLRPSHAAKVAPATAPSHLAHALLARHRAEHR